VVRPRGTARVRGGSKLGCLIPLALLVGAVYYGINIGEPWFRYWQIRDRMDVAARHAGIRKDNEIIQLLQDDAVEIGLPEDARGFRIVRKSDPPIIEISMAYAERVDLPLFHRTFLFRPVASRPR
jgi:hypothetical protein